MSPRAAGAISERRAWQRVRDLAEQLHHEYERGSLGDDIAKELIDLAEVMARQVQRRIHTNPATLAVWGNPPGGLAKGAEELIYVDEQIAFKVHDIRYEHIEDRQFYRHPFASGVQMWSVLRGDRASTRHQHQDVMLTRPDGKSLWDDF